MKIQFIYPNFTSESGDINLGIASLSAVLKEYGHKTSLIHLKKDDKGMMVNKTYSEIKKFDPDIVALSLNEFGAKYAEKLANVAHDRFRVVGGPYPTLNPSEFKYADYVVRGEGEEQLLNIVHALEDGRNVEKIKPSLPDINELPFPDRSIFDDEVVVGGKFGGKGKFKDLNMIGMMGSRGCPFDCTYCINKHVRKLYSGGYTRLRSVDSIIDEINWLMGQYDFEAIGFYDDTMLLNKEWVSEFSKKYEDEVGLPFYCNARPETCSAEMIKDIKSAGCARLQIGVESGSEKIRKIVLHRMNCNKMIKDAFKSAKAMELETYSFNMVGLPGETIDDIKKTIRLNVAVKPDIVQVSAFYPFKNTELGNMCHENGWVMKKGIDGYYDGSIVDYPQLRNDEIEYWLKNFMIHYGLQSGDIVGLGKNLGRKVLNTMCT